MEQMLNSEEKKASSVPYLRPPFTYGDVKRAIPPHCFERSVITSFSYLLSDLAIIFSLFYIFTTYIKEPVLISWIIYSLLQGSFLVGLWMIGHECSHHAFSDYQWLDDTVGFIIHSLLLFPYFSFKYTHGHHHSRTGSLHYEGTNPPMLKSQVPSFFKHLSNTAVRFLVITLLLATGLPLHLLINFRGRDYGRFASHFDPLGPMFSRNQFFQVLLSDAGFLATVYGLYNLVLIKGFAWVAFVYGGPYLVMCAFLMVVLVLNHTHTFVPYYDSSEWDWLRGSLCTIDRDFGILNKVFHRATNAHVAHHLFTNMPHYHIEEATRAFKPILGEHYHYDDTPFYKSFWITIKECVYVEEDKDDQNKGLYWFRNKF
ncbi:delta(12)-fatty-acid desaturase FAD2 [Heracleum sosnowskyi]|uniref:Delta(12)-fatty-acid desaturase FAD2 n=1 Tax=Heracleum sosnowskyi TaxID=360622 RepID=A0AAD8GZL1_9APIA|nr:delta(12)-fatty-acid desaturase FAD2 [Heracleum sosnowskyi]